MNRRRILIYVDWFYPGFRGGGPIVSILNLIREISNDFELFVFTSAYDYKTSTPYEDIIFDKWIDFQGIAKVFYCTKQSPEFIFQAIRKTAPHTVYLNSMFSPYFTVLPLIFSKFWFRKQIEKVVLAPRGMLISGNFQFKFHRKKIFLQCFKMLRLNRNLVVHASSLEESQAARLKLNIIDEKILIVPNIPDKRLICEYFPAPKKVNELDIYFASRIGREKNILYSLQIIKEFSEPINFYIHGNIDHQEYWTQCEAVIKKLPQHIRVFYKGAYQPDEKLTLFQNYHVFLFPSFGENFSHVIAEALSLGKPVITTPEMPWKDIEKNGAGWIIDMTNKDRYKDVLKKLFEMNQEEYNQHSKSAFSYAEKVINQTNYRVSYQQLFS